VTGTDPSAAAPKSSAPGWKGLVAAAVVTNALPAVGVLFLGWNVAAFAFYYFLECAVLGSLAIVEITRVKDGAPVRAPGYGKSAMSGPVPKTRYYRLVGGLVVVSAFVALSLMQAAFPSGGARLTVLCALTLLIGRALVEYRRSFVGERQYLDASSAELAARFFLRFALLLAMVVIVAALGHVGLTTDAAGRLGVFLLVIAWAAADVWRARTGASRATEGPAREDDGDAVKPARLVREAKDVRGGPTP
jgi:hypothetical protein